MGLSVINAGIRCGLIGTQQEQEEREDGMIMITISAVKGRNKASVSVLPSNGILIAAGLPCSNPFCCSSDSRAFTRLASWELGKASCTVFGEMTTLNGMKGN